jgi:O-succinylbenzoic acid--CoA ligase
MSQPINLMARAALTPAAPALESIRGTWTFAELAERAGRAAQYIVAAAPAEATPIALLLPGDERFVAWFHAIALTGRVVIPLNTRLTAEELAQQLTDARVGWLLGEETDARLDALAASVPGLRATPAPKIGTLPSHHDRWPEEAASKDATLAVLFTSGTSGRSKGALLSRGNFDASADAAADRLGPAVAGRWLACMPLFHVGGLSIVMRSVRFGGPIRLMSRFEAGMVSAALDAGDIAGVSLVPTMLSRLLAFRAGKPVPKGLEVLLLGGAAAAPELVSRAREAGYPVCLTYGLTEATSQVATAGPPRPGSATVPPMRPLHGTRVRIVTDDGDAPAGVPGEIVVRGPTVMQGYLHDPAATARALRGGWLFTGDVGFLDQEGGLHVLDRRDDLVVSGGENVYPAEVEAILLEHASVAEAGVTGVPDPDLGSRVVAWIVAEAGAAPEAATLLAFCRERLAGYKCPREFRFVEALPRTAAGKLQRRRLVEVS